MVVMTPIKNIRGLPGIGEVTPEQLVAHILEDGVVRDALLALLGSGFRPEMYGGIADALSDGTDNSSAIQEALDAAEASNPSGDTNFGGNAVQFGAGKYGISSPLFLPGNVAMDGLGIGITEIYALPDYTGGPMIQSKDDQSNWKNRISKMTLNGRDKDTGGGGIYLIEPNWAIINEVDLYHINGNAIEFADATAAGIAVASRLHKVHVEFCSGIGIDINSSCTDVNFDTVDVGLCDEAAYFISGSSATFQNTSGWGSSVGCYLSQYAQGLWMSNCRFDQNKLNGMVIECQDSVFTGVFVHSNSLDTFNWYPGIKIAATADNLEFTGINVNGQLDPGFPHQGSGIEIDAGHGWISFTGGAIFNHDPGKAVIGTGLTSNVKFESVRGVNFGDTPAPLPDLVAPTVVGSGSALVNPYPFDVWVMATGENLRYIQSRGIAVGMSEDTACLPVQAGGTFLIHYDIGDGSIPDLVFERF